MQNSIPEMEVLDQLPINSWAFPRILLGIPLERAVSHADEVFVNFMQIAIQGPALLDIPYGRIDVVRNLMATALLESEYTHLLMLDIDHKHPTDIIQRLSRWVLAFPDVKVVSGINFRRGAPFDPIAGTHRDATGKQVVLTSWPEGLFKVNEVGAGSLLVSREVFEQLEPPWFFNIYDEVMQNSFPGEDIGFSRKCAAAGIDMFVDSTTSSPHCTTTFITAETFHAYRKAYPEHFND
jgi:hypothetical protein